MYSNLLYLSILKLKSPCCWLTLGGGQKRALTQKMYKVCKTKIAGHSIQGCQILFCLCWGFISNKYWKVTSKEVAQHLHMIGISSSLLVGDLEKRFAAAVFSPRLFWVVIDGGRIVSADFTQVRSLGSLSKQRDSLGEDTCYLRAYS